MKSPASKEQSRPAQSFEAPYYTQVNILFPSSQVELPAADKFKAFPEEAQKAILAAFALEQKDRHEWLKEQQKIDFELNSKAQSFNFYWRLAGMITGTIIVIATLYFGVSLIKAGASSTGVAMIIATIATLIGTAIYGHRATAKVVAAKQIADLKESK